MTDNWMDDGGVVQLWQLIPLDRNTRSGRLRDGARARAEFAAWSLEDWDAEARRAADRVREAGRPCVSDAFRSSGEH